ncbi:hypothetical protein K2173_026718 [Erythroxylum novogranatense]|uniref:DET1- and DDB1-associated protein 1 domain-containing protein n=1 Tax=Erythroxylum novogranatense TaxID=1862640 RepID=A0AAV8TYB9_9ROSI|nr:hypothetical protein K2173_026718 [Erythroxylum novogranatense]
MEDSSSHPFDSNLTATGASKFLTNLPSRGFLSSTVLSSNPGGMRVYICDRDTSPPEGQLIKTNQTNILIRSLQLKKQKGESSSKDVKGAHATDGSRKRAPERVLDSRASAKRNNSQPGPRQGEQLGSASRTSERDLQCLTDELVARLKSVNG